MTAIAMRSTELAMLPLELVRESPDNPRRYIDPVKLDELTESIRSRGLDQPVTVRPRDGGAWYELAAGHRRRRASEAAGLTHIPALVRELDDDAFLELLNVDNLQRDDLHPMDESFGYAQMQAKLEYDVAALALKVGKSVSYIYQRLSLQRLIPAAQELFWKGEMVLGHAVLLVRANAEQQQAALDDLWAPDSWRRDNDEAVSVSDLRGFLEQEVYRNLEHAPWDADDANLLPSAGACTTCEKRSGCSPSLFPDIESADTCLDGTCFDAKLAAAINAKLVMLWAEHGRALRLTNQHMGTKVDVYGDQPIPRNQWWPVKANTKGAIAGVMVDGYNLGETVFVTLAQPKGRDVEPAYDNSQYKKEQAARDAKVKAERTRRAELLDAIVVKLPTAMPLGAEDLRYLIAGFVEEMHFESRKLAARRIDPQADAQESVAVIAKWAKGASIADLVTFLMVLPLIPALQVPSWGEIPTGDTLLDVTATRLKVKAPAPVAEKPAKKRAGDVARSKKAATKTKAKSK